MSVAHRRTPGRRLAKLLAGAAAAVVAVVGAVADASAAPATRPTNFVVILADDLGSPELGYKVAFCERDVAIYLSVLVTGLVYGWRRGPSPGKIGGLSMTAYALLILPMAIDGFSQLFQLRESSVELRTLTGLLFGAASVWLIYPRIDAILARDLGPATPRLRELDAGARSA